MRTRIRCDVCGADVSREEALVVETSGEVVYLCSQECRENLEYHEIAADPGPDEDQSSPPG